MKKVLAAILFLLASAQSAYAQGYIMRISNDPGGRIGTFIEKYQPLRQEEAYAEVSGFCNSACTIILGALPKSHICVTTPTTKFGFHAAWDFGANGQEVPNPEGTSYLLHSYPANVRRIIAARGGLRRKAFFVSGRALGYALCKHSERTFAQTF